MGRPWVRNLILVLCFGAAAAAGYLVSARVGSEALRREVQVQLGRLLLGEVQIGRARLVIRGGLFLEGDRVGVYPRENIPRRPKLFASHVSAELDTFALITGRFALASLTVDDLVFEIDRSVEGRFSPTPLERLQEAHLEQMPEGMERNLDLLNAFEAVTRTLLERPIVARTVEVRRGRVYFLDQSAVGRVGEPLQLSMHHINGRLVHHWPSNEAELTLDGLLQEEGEAATPIHAEGHRRRGEALTLSLSSDGFRLSVFDHYLASGDGGNSIAGIVSGEVRYETRALGHGQVDIGMTVNEFDTTINVRRGHFVIQRPSLELEARIEIHPGRVRLESARLETQGMELDLRATIERPLGLASRMRIETEVGGLDLDEVNEIARSLPGEDGQTLENLLEGVLGGRIDRIGGGGIAPLADWQALLLGELLRLPPGFTLSADLANIRVSTGGGDSLERLAGHVEISGDRLSFSNATALFKDEPLPTLNLTLDGVSSLFRPGAGTALVTRSVDPLPGVDTLWKVLERNPDAKRPEEPTVFVLRLDHVEHPMFRWPIRDARVRITPNETGALLEIEDGFWSNAPISGDALWTAEGEQALDIQLRLAPPPPTAAETASAADLSGPDDAFDGEGIAVDPDPAPAKDGWAAGRFEINAIADAPLPLRSLHGEFALRARSLHLTRVRADLDPEGKLVGSASFDLGSPDEVAISTRITINGSTVNDVGVALGMPEGFATGRLHISGRLDGALRAGEPILSDLQGSLTLDARDGEIRRDELPLVLALAQATAGYNSFADRSAVAYEAVTAILTVDRGRISCEDLRVEGPLRVYGSGWIDAINPPYPVEGLVGIFLFRGAGQLMETVPLVKAILPGSERGLVGAYYMVNGSFDAPKISPLRGKTIAEDLPGVLTAPFKVLQALLGGGGGKAGSSKAQRAPKAGAPSKSKPPTSSEKAN